MLDGMPVHISSGGEVSIHHFILDSWMSDFALNSAAPQPLAGKVYTYFNSKVRDCQRDTLPILCLHEQ